MKHLFTLIMLLATCSASFAQATASTNQTISVGAIATLELDLRAENIEIRPTKGSRVIIESHVTLEKVTNTSMLEYLIKAGRYELITNMDASSKALSIQRKVNSNVILVKGQECTEKVRYVVLVPESIQTVKQNGTNTPVE